MTLVDHTLVSISLEDDVRVWVIDVTKADASESIRLLSDEERRRCERFAHAELRHRYAAAHSALREILAQVVNEDSSGLQICPLPCQTCGGPHGKPALVEPGGSAIEFNMSHAGDLAVVVTSKGRPVGIDVEQARPVDAVALARRFFTREEHAFVASCPVHEQGLAFARLWTRKEAHLKAIGCGLPGGLTAISVPGWTPLHVVERGAGGPYTITDLDFDDRHLGAVAVGRTPRLTGAEPS
ncbi:MAG: hypothetical protein JJLCMIEE_01049 [Acidimicrobiales bacterium]|nr:hypothetical protein [Acidimicrobiales bacterium]